MLITGTTQGIGYQLYKYYKDKYNIITINRQDIGDNNNVYKRQAVYPASQ